jgi:hypothetical protein
VLHDPPTRMLTVTDSDNADIEITAEITYRHYGQTTNEQQK